MEKEYGFSIDISVNKVLTENEKCRLMVELTDVVKNILGEPKGATVMICSDKE